MKATIPIGIQPGTRLLRIARSPETVEYAGEDQRWFNGNGYWIIWLHTNDFIHGTFLRLHDNGLIENVTIRSDRPDEDIFIVKPPDQ